MSVIPKIAVSRPTKRQKSKLSFDCSTSANLGDIQPTMARLMVPGQTNHVKVNSLVRLASMPAPTFARMHLRHYHAFVPYSQLWEPFSAFLSAQRYSGHQTTFIPQAVPRFQLHAYWAYFIRQYSFVSICDQNGNPYTYDPNNAESLNTVRQALARYNQYCLTGDKRYFGLTASEYMANVGPATLINNSDTTRGCFVFGNYKFVGSDLTGETPLTAEDFLPLNVSYNELGSADVGSVSILGADYVEEISGSNASPTYLAYKFTPQLKHLRKIVIGLGYQFTPSNYPDNFENIFKLIAYYKTWFEYFRPLREKSFTDTSCYDLIKALSDADGRDFQLNGSATVMWQNVNAYLRGMLTDLMDDTYYYLPQDYFSMAVSSPQLGNSDQDTLISSPYSDSDIGEVLHSSIGGNSQIVVDPDENNPLIVKLAQRLLTFTNKNTVIGRSIREYIRVHYGVFEDYAPDSSGITRIGVSDVQVKVSTIMSTAPGSEGFLGEYAGVGVGRDASETFDYTAKEFGVWLTLSVVVPQSGYYQGTLKENFYKERFDFPIPEFDAQGYQVLERRELMDSYCANSPLFNPSKDYLFNAGFGFVPRYSDVKVARNIVNGDLSINGESSLRAYFFDRRFPEVQYLQMPNNNLVPLSGVRLKKPDFIPSVVFDNFRRVDQSDSFGQYNRIFNVTSNWVDHFILNNIFEVTAIAPWKSLNDSFDTFVEGEDAINVIHS